MSTKYVTKGIIGTVSDYDDGSWTFILNCNFRMNDPTIWPDPTPPGTLNVFQSEVSPSVLFGIDSNHEFSATGSQGCYNVFSSSQGGLQDLTLYFSLDEEKNLTFQSCQECG